MESVINSIIFGFGVIFSLGLFIISLNSYQRSKNKKIFFVSFVLFFFFIKFILLSISLFYLQLEDLVSIMLLSVFDLIILVLLYVAILAKS